jgi:hypothetical protein
MKKLVLVMALVMGIQASHAQSWEEWFRQRKTQIRYLLNQIAALQTHLGYVKKGYQVAKDGTTLIRDIKQGDFKLHSGYFTSLKSVSPAIRNYSKVTATISDGALILKLFRELKQYCNQNALLSASEKAYVRSVQTNITAVCEQELEELFLVLTSGELEMKSDERIKKVDRLYASMKDKVSFARSFSGEVRMLVVHRKRERSDIEKAKKFWEIK